MFYSALLWTERAFYVKGSGHEELALLGEPEHQQAQPFQGRLQPLRLGDQQDGGDEQGHGDLAHAGSIAPPPPAFVGSGGRRL